MTEQNYIINLFNSLSGDNEIEVKIRENGKYNYKVVVAGRVNECVDNLESMFNSNDFSTINIPEGISEDNKKYIVLDTLFIIACAYAGEEKFNYLIKKNSIESEKIFSFLAEKNKENIGWTDYEKAKSNLELLHRYNKSRNIQENNTTDTNIKGEEKEWNKIEQSSAEEDIYEQNIEEEEEEDEITQEQKNNIVNIKEEKKEDETTQEQKDNTVEIEEEEEEDETVIDVVSTELENLIDKNNENELEQTLSDINVSQQSKSKTDL